MNFHLKECMDWKS